jgi:hypothetical protein
MGSTEIRRICQLDKEGRGLAKAAMQQLMSKTILAESANFLRPTPHPINPIPIVTFLLVPHILGLRLSKTELVRGTSKTPRTARRTRSETLKRFCF